MRTNVQCYGLTLTGSQVFFSSWFLRHFVLAKLASSSIHVGVKGRPFNILVAGLFLSPLSEPDIFLLMGEPEILNFKGQIFILCTYTFLI